jgi:hypothetical protein
MLPRGSEVGYKTPKPLTAFLTTTVIYVKYNETQDGVKPHEIILQHQDRKFG